MDVNVSPNPYLIENVAVERHESPGVDLVVLTITERSAGGHTSVSRVVIAERFWQQIADRLAGRGIVASPDAIVMEPCS